MRFQYWPSFSSPLITEQEKDWDSPLVFQPGTDWVYGTGIDWAGKVVEQVSKKSLEDFMQENIWGPLGMTNTTFHPEKRVTYPLLDMGTRSALGAPLEPCELIYPIPARHESGGAGIFSSCEDYAKLLGALLREDFPILRKETLEEMFAPQLNLECKKGLADKRAAGFPLPEISTDIPASFSLAGLYVEEPIPGRRARGTVAWDGMCSPNWVRSQSSCRLLSRLVLTQCRCSIDRLALQWYCSSKSCCRIRILKSY
jgi:CubicO group peptidase (beta-lactamase class C family)